MKTIFNFYLFLYSCWKTGWQINLHEKLQWIINRRGFAKLIGKGDVVEFSPCYVLARKT